MNKLSYYARIWQAHLKLSFHSAFSKRIDGVCYSLGKLVRFAFVILLLNSLFHNQREFLGYTMPEMVLIFLTFNIIDVLAQILFRGLYGFGHEVNRGLFDFTLIRPANPLFLSLTRIVDTLDIIFLIPVLLGFVFVTPLLDISAGGVIAFFYLMTTGMLLATAFHIFIAATIITMRDDSIVMAFRLVGRFAMFPQETYHTAIRFVLIFLFPVLTMAVFPSQALLGKLPPIWFGAAFLVTVVFFTGSLIFWRHTLTRYSSASS